LGFLGIIFVSTAHILSFHPGAREKPNTYNFINNQPVPIATEKD